MSDPFFTKKRKRSAPKKDRLTSKGPQRGKKAPKDDEISSDSEVGEGRGAAAEYSDGDDFFDAEIENETPAEKRMRIAKEHIDMTRHEIADAEGIFDAAEIDR